MSRHLLLFAVWTVFLATTAAAASSSLSNFREDRRKRDASVTQETDPPSSSSLMQRMSRANYAKNFLRFGRPSDNNVFYRIDRGISDSKNFLRFGKGGVLDKNFLRFGRGGLDKNFLRFGKGGLDKNFLRFGRGKLDKNFLRFGKKSGLNKNFLRFGRKELEESPNNAQIDRQDVPDINDIIFSDEGNKYADMDSENETGQDLSELENSSHVIVEDDSLKRQKRFTYEPLVGISNKKSSFRSVRRSNRGIFEGSKRKALYRNFLRFGKRTADNSQFTRSSSDKGAQGLGGNYNKQDHFSKA